MGRSIRGNELEELVVRDFTGPTAVQEVWSKTATGEPPTRVTTVILTLAVLKINPEIDPIKTVKMIQKG